MGRVCSMESKATVPILVRRAGTRVAKTYSPPLGRERSWHVSGKKAPGLHTYLGTSLRNPPRARPVLSSDPQKTTTGTLQHQRRNSQQYRVPYLYLYLSGPITPQKGPTTASTRKLFLPDQPRDTSFSNAYLIFDMLMFITRRTHTSNLPSSYTRTVHLVPPNSLKRHSRISSASVLPPRCGM